MLLINVRNKFHSLGCWTLARSRDTEGNAVATKHQLALQTQVNNMKKAPEGRCNYNKTGRERNTMGERITEEPIGPRISCATAWMLEPLTLRPLTATKTSPLCTWTNIEKRKAPHLCAFLQISVNECCITMRVSSQPPPGVTSADQE